MNCKNYRTIVANHNGSTFMEVIVVIAVVGIMAAVGLSRMKSSPAETQRANAAHVVINDFRYAQEIAMTYGRSVRIDVETGLNLYSLKWHDTNEYLPSITGTGNYIRRFGENEFENVSITNTDLTNSNLRFRTNGEPLTNGQKLTQSRIALTLNNKYKIMVTPETGLVTILMN